MKRPIDVVDVLILVAKAALVAAALILLGSFFGLHVREAGGLAIVNAQTPVYPINRRVSGNSAIVPIDVNRASIPELIRLPGIDEKIAQRIVDGRPYRSRRELREKGILTRDAYRRLRGWLVVGER
jgi:predicted DNA-binding helix-hairpin-helix protein